MICAKAKSGTVRRTDSKRIVIKQLRGQMRLEADLVAFGASASAAGHRKNDASLKHAQT